MAEAKHPVRRNTRILAGIVVAILLLCVCPLWVVGFMRAAAPAVSTAVVTTEPKNIGATVEVHLPTKELPTPTSIPHGFARSDPYPLNTPVQIAGDMEVTVLGVERPANETVTAGNMFNDTPAPGSEYMIVTLAVKCRKATDEKCTFDPYEFKTVGADGQVRDQASAAGVPGRFESYPEFFGGSILQGQMVFLAGQNDPLTVLFYDPLFGYMVYFGLSDQ